MSNNANGKSFGSKTVATLGMMCAIAFVAKLISSVFPTVSGFLSFDLKDVIIVIAGFMSGPVAAVVVTVVVSVIEMITISSTGVIGLVMNVLQSCAFACTASVIYLRHKSLKGAVIGLVSGVLRPERRMPFRRMRAQERTRLRGPGGCGCRCDQQDPLQQLQRAL